MAKHALVVGSQTASLAGPIGDAEQMAAALEAAGFKIDLRTTAASASCAGIRRSAGPAAGAAADRRGPPLAEPLRVTLGDPAWPEPVAAVSRARPRRQEHS